MRKFQKHLYIYIVSLLFSFSFYSCDNNAGLGEQVDLEAPVLSIKSMISEESDEITGFSGGVYCHKSVTFKGTATDNNRVSKVYTQIKWASDDSDFSDFQKASISGDSWTLSFSFEKEGVALLKFIATDPAGNVAAKSTKTLILFVDEDAPVGSAWYIDRQVAGIQYKLHELEELKALDLSLSENKDASQNIKFSISASFTDTMGISTDYPPNVSIWNEKGENIIEKIQKTDDSSVYQPVFEISESLLASGHEELASGLHYLQVRYSAWDVVKVPSANSVEDTEFDGGWFIWWPESDIPRYELSETVETGESGEKSINVFVKNVFNVTIFDDDELASAEYIFEYTEDEESKTTAKTAEIKSGEREKTLVVSLPSTPQTAYLTVKASGSGETDGGKSLDEKITVNVIDATSPMLLITSPKNNSVPEVAMTGTTNAKVTISGTALDVSGCQYLEFVWVPDSIASGTAEKSSIAKAFLSSLETDSAHKEYAKKDSVKKTEISDVGVLWSVPLTKTGSSDGFITQTFEFSIDLFTDFASVGNAFTSENKTTSDKFFVARLIRSGETGTYSEYKLAGDTSNPTIYSITPTGDMAIISGSESLTLEFKGVKSSGMTMDTTAYEIRRVDASANDGKFGTYDSSLKYATVTGKYDSATDTYKSDEISTEVLKEWKDSSTKPTFQFFAKDLLGNKGEDQFTIVISTLPMLKSITSPSSTPLKKGDTLSLSAVFDNTVTVSDTSGMYVKLTGFSDNTERKAKYVSGSGSTTLVFEYEIQDGDSSSQVQVNNDDGSPIAGLSSTIARLVDTSNKSVVKAENLVQAKKTIVVDGIPPVATVSASAIKSDILTSELSNYQNGGFTYLKESRTLSVTVTSNEDILISGSPKFVFIVGQKKVELPFTGGTSRSIVFSKKIASTDEDGELTYIPKSCIDGSSLITDAAGNPITLPSETTAVSSQFIIDTKTPDSPTVTLSQTNYSGTLNNVAYYANSASFTITRSSSDTSIKSVEYSPDGGNTWESASFDSEITLKAEDENYSSVQLVCRATDYAGNVSEYSDAKNIYINNTFPAFTVECTNADGNYKAGSTLVFKVTFDSKVNVAASSAAYILVTGLNAGDSYGKGANDGKAYLSDKNGKVLAAAQSSVSSVYFTYETQDPDEFTLKVEKANVVLTGFTDLYGITQNGKTLGEDYERSGIKCDGVSPKVKSMKPDGEGTTNIYSNAKKITLEFTEPINRASGNITIRRVANWALPPVLTATEFSTIANAVTSEQKNILSIQEGGLDMEDSESLYQATIGSANIYYHGTGQFVGPYKKSTQGIKLSGGSYVPDISTKYVLDFDMGIWETDTTHYYGKSFRTTGSATTSKALENGVYATTSTGESVIPKTGSELSYTRTANELRAVLEAAHYHERIVDVTSGNVTISADRKTVTVNFPEGLVGDDDLPSGIEWEVVIDKGTFMDDTGNYFGANATGVLEKSDARQKPSEKGSQEEISASTKGTWVRGRTSVTDGSQVVLIQTSNGKDSFLSSGVSTPVIRVDRYSYGLGTFQADQNGNKLSDYIADDKTKPTGYVRVRIDCQTSEATIKYKKVEKTATPRTDDNTSRTSPYYIETSNAWCYSYWTETNCTESDLTSATLSDNYTDIFAAGNGDYTKSCKHFIVAQAEHTNLGTSSKGIEGVFQTVVYLYAPFGNTGQSGSRPTDQNHFSIRGTTGWSGEPYIAPFPLRDSQVGSPYLRRCYREDKVTPAYSVSETPASTKEVTVTLGDWGSRQILSAQDIAGAKGIRVKVETSSTNFGIKGGANVGEKAWSNTWDFSDFVTMNSTIVSDANREGLYLEGEKVTFNITIELYNTELPEQELDHYDFYWVSYEIFVGTSFSGYSWHGTSKYDWCQNWGWMEPGEFTKCVDMRNWQ